MHDTLTAESVDLWIFAYGSLMWNPCFSYAEARPADLPGYERRFCIWSWDARGTRAMPGLVLGLSRGRGCRGMAFRISDIDRAQSLRDLWQREMDGDVYIPTRVGVDTGRGTQVTALTFVANPHSVQYAHDLDLCQQRDAIIRARGQMGHNLEYLENTLGQCRQLNIHDTYLETLAAKMEARGRDA